MDPVVFVQNKNFSGNGQDLRKFLDPSKKKN